MRILGVDPGLTRCGMGTIDSEGGRRVNLVDMRVVRSNAELAPHKRLAIIADGLDEVIAEFKPDVVAGAHLAIGLHTPSEVKAAVTGSGRADKKQVQIMVQRILRMKELPRPADAADGLAIAITHAWRGGAEAMNAEPDRTQHGGAGTLPRATGRDLTEAQKLWASAERLSRRHRAVAPQAQGGE